MWQHDKQPHWVCNQLEILLCSCQVILISKQIIPHYGKHIFNTLWGLIFFFPHGTKACSGPGPPHYWRLHNHTVIYITLTRTPLDEWSAQHRDLYLTTHNTHNRQTSMPPAEFKPITTASEQLPTHALDLKATGIGLWPLILQWISSLHIT